MIQKTMSTKLYMEGDKSRAICSHCGKLVGTTFVRRDVPFSDGRGVAKDILVAVCDICDEVVATPAQSTPAIREARQRDVKSLEAQLPAIYIDALDLAAYTLDNESSTEFRKVLMTVYVHRFASGEYPISELPKGLAAAQSKYKDRRGGARRRLSMKVTPRIAEELNSLVKETAMSKTDVIKSVIFQIQSDVLESRKPGLMRELSALSLLAA